ncbi:MAG: hypothetical protein ACJA08_001978 [Cyclobacteriaceae bacterium]|jgi:hypothetical protein
MNYQAITAIIVFQLVQLIMQSYSFFEIIKTILKTIVDVFLSDD